jgi:hypothetical protein
MNSKAMTATKTGPEMRIIVVAVSLESLIESVEKRCFLSLGTSWKRVHGTVSGWLRFLDIPIFLDLAEVGVVPQGD